MNPIEAAKIISRMDMGLDLYSTDPDSKAPESLGKRIQLCRDFGVDFHPGMLYGHDYIVTSGYWGEDGRQFACDDVRLSDIQVLAKLYCLPDVTPLGNYKFENLTEPIVDLFSTDRSLFENHGAMQHQLCDIFSDMSQGRRGLLFEYGHTDGPSKTFTHAVDLYQDEVLASFKVTSENEPAWDKKHKLAYITPEMQKTIDEVLVDNGLPRAFIYSNMPFDESSLPK